MALQNWATLRFSDHRGILPESISWVPSGFAAVLSQSKTLGSDKNVLSRPLRVDNSCFVGESSWMKTGLQLLRDLATFSRDFLFPAPEKNFSGKRRMELKYEIGYAVQNRVMSLLKLNHIIIFPVPVTSFRTPHSGRSFLPSCCAALDFSKEERDYLGGWSPQGSDRYARIAGLRILNLQRAVARSIRQGPQGDSLGERETLKKFEDFMQQKNVAPETLCAISSAISSWDTVPEFSVPAALEVEFDPALSPIPSIPTAEPEAPIAKKKRCGQTALRSELLGENPEEGRSRIRENLPQGFKICISGKRSIRTVHRLGACYALPDIDYYSGTDVPKSSEYGVVCTLCSRQGVASSTLSSGTESSSSTIEDEA